MKSALTRSTHFGFWLRSIAASVLTILLGVASANAVGVTNKAVYTPAVQILQGSLPFSQNYVLSIVSPANYPAGTTTAVSYSIAVNAKPNGVSDATALSYLKLSAPTLAFSNPLETKTVTVTLTVPSGAVAGAYGFQIIAVGWPSSIVFDNVGASVNATTTDDAIGAPPTVVIGTPADGQVISVAPNAFPIQVPFNFTASANATDPVISAVTATLDGQTVTLTSLLGLVTRAVTGASSFTITQAGTYSVVVSATNAVGVATDTNQFKVVVTAAPPTVVINTPTPNSVYTYRTGSAATVVPFTFTANSNSGGIVTLTAKVDNANVAFTASGLGTLQATGTINLPYTTSGAHTVSVVTTDNYGTATASSNFTVNVVAPTPTIAISQPTAGASYTAPSGSTTVNVPYTFVTTSNNGFFVDSVSASLDGNAITVGSTTGLGTATATSTGTLPGVAAGSHTLVVKGISAGIEVSTSTNFTVTAVLPPPTVVINTPAAGSVFTRVSGAAALSIPLNFTGTSTPTSGVITQLKASLNGTALTVSSSTLGQRVATGAATMSVTNAGTYTISVTAIDAYGTASTTRTFSVVVVQPRTVYGSIFFDVDSDGNYDCEDFDLSGIAVKLLNSSGVVIATDVTDCGGDYSFCNIGPGTYTVHADGYTGLKVTTPNDRVVTVSTANVCVTRIGFGLDFAALRTLKADTENVAFWKSNLDKGSGCGGSGGQISSSTLSYYTCKIGDFALCTYDNISMKQASGLMGSTSSNSGSQLSKQLIASEYNYQRGAYIGGNKSLTFLFLWWGESVLDNPSKYGTSTTLFAKSWFGAYNDANNGYVSGPLP